MERKTVLKIWVKEYDGWRTDNSRKAEGSSRGKVGWTEKQNKYVSEWCHCGTGKLLVCFLWQCADCSVSHQCPLFCHYNRMELNKMVLYQLCISILLVRIFLVREQTHMHMLHKIQTFNWRMQINLILKLYYVFMNAQFSQKPQFWKDMMLFLIILCYVGVTVLLYCHNYICWLCRSVYSCFLLKVFSS